MSILPVALAGVKLLLGIGDASQDAGITALIALEQPALEYALDPAILANANPANPSADSGLSATLTLGVTECLAGSYLATAGRNPEALPTQATFKVATTEVSQKPLALPTALGAQLVAVGLARLAPFSRAARALAFAAAGGAANVDNENPVPLALGSGMGRPGTQPGFGGASGPPPDPVFDRALGVDGRTEPAGADDFAPPFFAPWFDLRGWGGEP